jgi:hypothetical protein
MKVFFIILFCGMLSIQQPQVIKLREFYRGEGVIFDKHTNYPFEEPDYKAGYTPTIDDIIETEAFYCRNYYDYWAVFLDAFGKSRSKLDIRYKSSSYVTNKYFKYNRQYIGYINKANDTIVVMVLLNFSSKKNAIERFDGWKERVILGFGEFYERNQNIFNYNLSQKRYILNIDPRALPPKKANKN